MESDEDLTFAKSCQTLCLKKSEIFISSFPGNVVFGVVSFIGYSKKQSFQFKHQEFLNFYLTILKIVKFFSENTSNVDQKGLILSKNESTNYFWIGTILQRAEVTEKVIKFGIEFNDTIIFEIIFNAEQFNELIHIFSELMLSCLCLKSFERELIEVIVSESSIKRLITLNNKKCMKLFLQKFKDKYCLNVIEEQNFVHIFSYYIELIVIFKKLKSLYNPENNDHRIEAIISN